MRTPKSFNALAVERMRSSEAVSRCMPPRNAEMRASR